MKKLGMTTNDPVWIFCDGSAGNHEAQRTGPAEQLTIRRIKPVAACGAAAVARNPQGEIIDWAWQALPPMTNNEAEYAGLLLGLTLAQRLQTPKAILVLDSDIVVGQMQGRFAVKSKLLRDWHWRACAAVRTLPAIRFYVIPRVWNELADALASQVCVSWKLLRMAIEEQEAQDRMTPT